MHLVHDPRQSLLAPAHAVAVEPIDRGPHLRETVAVGRELPGVELSRLDIALESRPASFQRDPPVARRPPVPDEEPEVAGQQDAGRRQESRAPDPGPAGVPHGFAPGR